VSYGSTATDLSSKDEVDYYEFVSFDQEPLDTPSICTHLPAKRGDILQVAKCLAHLGAACREDEASGNPACTFKHGEKTLEDKSVWIRHIGERLQTSGGQAAAHEDMGTVDTVAECAARCHQRTTRCRSFVLNLSKNANGAVLDQGGYGCTVWSLKLGDATVSFLADTVNNKRIELVSPDPPLHDHEYWEFKSYEQLPYGKDPAVVENGIQCTHRAPWNADILTVA